MKTDCILGIFVNYQSLLTGTCLCTHKWLKKKRKKQKGTEVTAWGWVRRGAHEVWSKCQGKQDKHNGGDMGCYVLSEFLFHVPQHVCRTNAHKFQSQQALFRRKASLMKNTERTEVWSWTKVVFFGQTGRSQILRVCFLLLDHWSWNNVMLRLNWTHIVVW